MRQCPICEKKLYGRIDKKFCSVPCKNEYHRKVRNANSKVIKTIDNFLHRNHTILYELMQGKKQTKLKINRVKLQKAGFRFSNYTGSYINNRGKIYYHVYDFSWMEFSNDEILIVKK